MRVRVSSLRRASYSRDALLASPPPCAPSSRCRASRRAAEALAPSASEVRVRAVGIGIGLGLGL